MKLQQDMRKKKQEMLEKQIEYQKVSLDVFQLLDSDSRRHKKIFSGFFSCPNCILTLVFF